MFENNHAYQRGQEDQNKILADHFIYFLNIDVVLAHRGRSERHGHRHRRWPPTPGNCDHNAPHSPRRACDRIAGDASATFARTDHVMPFPGRIVRWSGCWAKNGKMAMMRRNRRCPRIGARIRAETLAKRLQMALWAPFWDHNYPNTQKVDKMVGKNFILVLLTTLVCVVNPKHHFIRP